MPDHTFRYKLYQFHSLSYSYRTWYFINDSIVLNSDSSSRNLISYEKKGNHFCLTSVNFFFKVLSVSGAEVRYFLYLHNGIDTIEKKDCLGIKKVRVPKKYKFYYILDPLGSKYPDENLPKKGTLIVIKVPLQRVFRSEVWLNEENGIRPITTDGYRAVYILKRAGG